MSAAALGSKMHLQRLEPLLLFLPPRRQVFALYRVGSEFFSLTIGKYFVFVLFILMLSMFVAKYSLSLSMVGSNLDCYRI